MRKIPTLFLRDPDDRRYVLPKVNPECAWVLEGGGVATRKWDGTCTHLDEGGTWWARREVKPGKPAPDGFQLLQEDPVTGKKVGWEPIAQSAFAKYHAQALAIGNGHFRRGTYELLGPKVNGNPDRFEQHILIAHGWAPFSDRLAYDKAPRDYEALRTWLHARPHEGIVWHRDPNDPNGDMAKLKARDFPAPDTH